MQTAPLSSTFGLEIRGIELQGLSDPARLESFLDLLHRHQVIVVRDQKLTAAELAELGSWLGIFEPNYPAEFEHPEHPEIFVISNLMENGKPIGSISNGFGWHTDSIYKEFPSGYTMLYNIECPASGGETLFADMQAAYDALPDGMKQTLQGVQCTHSYNAMYSRRKNAPPMTEELKTKFPDVQHPVIRTHPVTGRKGLYLCKTTLTTAEASDGNEVDVSLIDELIAFATSPQFCYAHKGEPGDFLIWDNAGLMHSATNYDFKTERRLVYRMMTAGDRPF